MMRSNRNPIMGFLEDVRNNSVYGWCSSKHGSQPLIVKLYVDDIFIKARRADNEREDVLNNGGELLSGFNFHINRKLLKHLPRQAQVRIFVGDEEFRLPLIQGKSDIIQGGADDGGQNLRRMLADRWHVDHWGQLKIAFSKAPEMKIKCLLLYIEMRSFFKKEEGIDIYLTGGNLLGLVREFDFLEHDDDIDAAYCIQAEAIEEVADQFFAMFDRIVPKLIELGYIIDLVHCGQFCIIQPKGHGLDIFTGWLNSQNEWHRMTGAGGHLGTSKFNVREYDFMEHKVLLPQYSEKELDLTYGENWKERDLYFYWKTPKHIQNTMNKLQEISLERIQERKNALKNMNINS